MSRLPSAVPRGPEPTPPDRIYLQWDESPAGPGNDNHDPEIRSHEPRLRSLAKRLRAEFLLQTERDDDAA